MMKHTKFLALTAIAFAASSAMAESSVTLYGTLDVSVGSTKNSNSFWGATANALSPLGPSIAAANSTSTTTVSSGLMSPSFIGFKGTEDLGAGMEAQFVLESYLDADTGATSTNQQLLSAITRFGFAAANVPTAETASWNTRDEGVFWAKNAYIGLKTNFGLIRLGQMDNIGYLSAVKYNPFGSAVVNPTTRVFYGTDYYARAWSNTIAYYLKSDGLLFGVQYAPKNDSSTTTGTAGNQGGAKYSATISYGAGPLNVSLGYESNKDNLSSPGEAKSMALHGSYDFGVAKLFAGYGSGKQDAIATTSADVKSTGYHVGASVPVSSAGSFLASYAHGKLKADNGNVPSAAVGATFRNVKVFALGYDHSLSKRTSVYGVYTQQKDSYPIAVLNNLKLENKQFGLGVRHSF